MFLSPPSKSALASFSSVYASKQKRPRRHFVLNMYNGLDWNLLSLAAMLFLKTCTQNYKVRQGTETDRRTGKRNHIYQGMQTVINAATCYFNGLCKVFYLDFVTPVMNWDWKQNFSHFHIIQIFSFFKKIKSYVETGTAGFLKNKLKS